MTPVVSDRHGDPRLAVLLILVMALIVLPLTAGRKPPPAPALHLAADGTLLLLPDRRETAGQVTPPAETAPLAAPRLALFLNRPFPINRADHTTLTMLPGIGPRLADRILSFRIDHGPITSTADLRQINGIGPELAARLAPLLSYR